MDEEQLSLCVQNVLNTEDGYSLVKYLIEQSGCLDRSINFDTLREYYIRGRKDYGCCILELVQKYSFNKYIKILEEREEIDERRTGTRKC